MNACYVPSSWLSCSSSSLQKIGAIRCSGEYFEGKGCNCRLRFVAGGEFWRVNDARIWHIQWFKFWVKRNGNRTVQLWPGSSWALTDKWCLSQLHWNPFTEKLVYELVHGRHGGGQGGQHGDRHGGWQGGQYGGRRGGRHGGGLGGWHGDLLTWWQTWSARRTKSSRPEEPLTRLPVLNIFHQHGTLK